MFNLKDGSDLEKAGKSIGSVFAGQAADLEKSFTFHKSLGAHHDGLGEQHEKAQKLEEQRAADHKSMHDGMDNTDELKTDYAKGAAYHAGMAEVHKAIAAHERGVAKAHNDHAEAMKAQIDTMKATAGEWGGAVSVTKAAVTGGGAPDLTKGGLSEKFGAVTDALVTKALENITSNPKVAEALEAFALDHVNKMIGEKIGDKLVPSQVSGITPDNPHYIRAVPRTGQREVPAAAKVPIEFSKALAMPDGSDDFEGS